MSVADIELPFRGKRGSGQRQELQRLQAEQEKYNLLFETALNGIIIHDLEGRIAEVNPRMLEMLGYSHKELLSLRLKDLNPPGYEAPNQWAMDEVEQGKAVYLVRAFQRKDGSLFLGKVSASRFVIDGTTWVQGIVQDVTEEMKARDALKSSQAFLRASLNALSGRIAVLDAEGLVLAVNDAWGRHYAEDKGEGSVPVGANYLAHFHLADGLDPETAADVHAQLCAVLDGEKETVQYEYPCPHSFDDGWFAVRANRFVLDGAVHMVVTHEDVTGLRRAEKALHEQAIRTRAMVEGALDSIITFSEEDGVLDVNRAAIQLFGYSAEEIHGCPITELIMPLPDFSETSRDGEASLLDHHIELEGRHADGTLFPIEIAVNTFVHYGQRLYAVYVRDITERHRQEQHLLDAWERIEAADRLKTAILTNLSHEIRTPMAGILGFADLMARELTGPYQRFAAGIRTSGERLMKMMTMSTNLALLEAEEYDAVPERLDLVAVSIRLLEAMQATVSSPQLTVSFQSDQAHIEALIPPRVYTDVFNQLVENAIKFTPEGRADIWLAAYDSVAVLRVTDTGIGITDDFMPHLFEAFTQESTGMGRQYEGNGLGLAMVQHYITLCGGTIEVESAPEQGSIFTVYLPFYTSNEA